MVTSSGFGDTHGVAVVKGPGVVTGRYGTIGEVFYVQADFWPLNTTLFVRDFHGNDPLFVSYLLRTVDFQSHSGKSGVPGVNRNDIHELAVQVPSPDEQRRIAAALSDVDALLAKLDQLIAKKRDLKQAAMQQLLPGHLRLAGHDEPWPRARLGDLFDFRNGVNADKRAYGRGIQFINVLEVITRPHLTADHVPGRVLLARGMQETFAVRRGDVLFNRTSETQGEVALASAYIDDTPMVFGGFVIRGRPKAQRLDALYAGYGLRAPEVRQQLVARGQGAIRSNVGQAELSAVEIRLPCVREQQSIAAVLSDMDTELAALEARRDKTRQLKQGMMQALLTGRIRLT
ncbi:MAG: EcoKI restriction-modification system protein HsdS [Candidatus Accumulibacter sp. BA-94]|nr:MAG: EcoKI restriction-modification system protein HsdS [Candidatus Accumulibacter sp. BA-94]